MSTELIVSGSLLVLEVILLIFLYTKSRKPPVPGQVRLFPYTLALLVVTICLFLTLAHIVSLLTGTQVQPKRPKGMR